MGRVVRDVEKERPLTALLDEPGRCTCVCARAHGVSNVQALQAVRINAAKYAHADQELGTVERGKVADLVMVRGNPLENVANAANVEMVMKNGVVHTIADILRPYR
jgi:imidazolonepropionase-like amidohydrolase